MYLVDTNIFLEVLLLQDGKEECENFLDLIRSGKKTGVVTDFTIHSIIVIMYNLNKLKELKIFLSSLTAYKGECGRDRAIRNRAAARTPATPLPSPAHCRRG